MTFDPLHATLGKLLDQAADAHPTRTAVIFKDRALSFAELRERADRLAAGLARVGLGRGDHLAVWLRRGTDWVVVELAAVGLGLVVVPISTRYELA